MTAQATQHQVEQFLFRNAEYCDRQQWDDYLANFDEALVFHVPQWDSEHVYTTDPQREMSMVYYDSRQGLEDRVFRLRTGKSAASTPLPRTLHMISNVCVINEEPHALLVKAKWVTHYVRLGIASTFFGEVDYELAKTSTGLKIRRKHVLLLNDKINAVLDFYHL